MKKRSKLDLSSSSTLDKVQAVHFDELPLEEAAPGVATIRSENAEAVDEPKAKAQSRSSKPVHIDELQLEEVAPDVAAVRSEHGEVVEERKSTVRRRSSTARRPSGRKIAGTVVLVAVAALAVYALTRRLLR